MAVTLPTASEATATAPRICCQSTASGQQPLEPQHAEGDGEHASFGAEPISTVTGVGAPW